MRCDPVPGDSADIEIDEDRIAVLVGIVPRQRSASRAARSNSSRRNSASKIAQGERRMKIARLMPPAMAEKDLGSGLEAGDSTIECQSGQILSPERLKTPGWGYRVRPSRSKDQFGWDARQGELSGATEFIPQIHTNARRAPKL